MKVLVIFNPAAGLRESNEIEIIKDFLNRHNFDYTLFKTTIEEGPYEILSKNKNNHETIIACGGDGTVSETIRGMHSFSYDCPLLVVPIGTSNEIAQNLGLKNDSLNNILNRLFKNDILQLDYGLINDNDTFTYALTFGNFTEVTYKTPQKMKNWLGYRAYVLYAFLSFRKIKSYKIKVKSNEVELNGNYLFGAISNSITIGNVVQYDEENISLCDGKFEVLLISEPENIKELRLIIKGLILKEYDNEAFTVFKTNNLTVQSKVDIDWNIDGEFAGSYKNITIANLHKKINLFV